ncbi:CDP-diacylglycerol--glycerol-3-phosphate 3-phosphatidyltransferase [Ruicaihuangia caeni]|uniref:CDP-diacylglycerol--glycerol-3-phosphate 3-phosphatidyltransferase n=1 Tax=Ruicaihuangia caeni TaxID=3042517 RepID=A0AAW6TB89_9MICO|nr:CDP-diacylglycerol--glycerol-3-phosphate 3-phosphatidyltransferase [Klugiella sp. YN-L-19]MDI2099724.1 CDP-diacylglycerol--glycerol-3-phosphate 3-phosphatidyltransferase [Klugiella sp. YN-L-19]
MTNRGDAGAQALPPSNWNAPNIITVVRICFIPAMLWLLIADAGRDDTARWVAAALFIVAIATDGIDGAIARRYNLITDLGKLLDPIADKGLTGAALVGLAMLGELPWWVVAIVLVRELGITLWRLVELRRGLVIPASRGGKIKTVSQGIAISLAMLPLWIVLGEWVHWLNGVTMTVAVVLTLASGLDYLVRGWNENRGAAGDGAGGLERNDE